MHLFFFLNSTLSCSCTRGETSIEKTNKRKPKMICSNFNDPPESFARTYSYLRKVSFFHYASNPPNSILSHNEYSRKWSVYRKLMKLQCRSDNPQIWQVYTIKQVKKNPFGNLDRMEVEENLLRNHWFYVSTMFINIICSTKK